MYDFLNNVDMGLRSLLTVRPAGKQCGWSEWRGRAASESCFNHWDKFLKSEAVLRFPHPASRGCYEIRAQWKGKQRKGQKGLIPSPLTSSVRPSPPSSPRGNARVGSRQIQQLNHDLKNSISRNPHLSIQGIPGKTGP